ncbi:CG5048 [Drosophila busckii]|uniref:CG5048 n=1 Tax=Drosophila busckii TaxID=30019 RepID=A0A0M4EIM0_DROBS|nr:protein PIH1D3 [Drosophila busckii]ALC44615.1 CG5048 [Drosophila busckii]
MSLFDNPEQLRQLQNLLYPSRRRRGGVDAGSSSSEDEGESLVVQHKQTPGSIGPQDKQKKKQKVNLLATPLQQEAAAKPPPTLEEWHEQQQREDADALDQRKCPEYTMTYRQAVGTEDVFLQMGQRTGASSSCEDLVLEICLPDEQMSADKMNLTLNERDLDLGTALYRLKMPLPHPVDVDRCEAKYDSELRKLRLTLRLRRELDYVNF